MVESGLKFKVWVKKEKLSSLKNTIGEFLETNFEMISISCLLFILIMSLYLFRDNRK